MNTPLMWLMVVNKMFIFFVKTIINSGHVSGRLRSDQGFDDFQLYQGGSTKKLSKWSGCQPKEDWACPAVYKKI